MGGTLISGLDLMLRGGACVLLVLLAAVLVRDHGRVLAARLGALFAAGAAVYALWSSPEVRAGLGPLRVPMMAIANGDNVVFWLFARALFDDDFRLRPWHGALWAAVAGPALVCGLVLQPAHSPLAVPIDTALNIVALGFAMLAVVQTVASWAADLVERRRRVRVGVVAAAAGYIALNAAIQLADPRGDGPGLAGLAGAAGLAAIAVGVAWSFLRVSGGAAALFPGEEAPAPAAAELAPADLSLVAALERAMAHDRAYRQDGLTIGRLAHAHGVPEYRLRRVINQGLGHRNFNSFLNRYRIADAKAGLADPSQAQVPILTIALDAGFNSLGPFNRAFRAETGMTPSEYRRQALGDEAGISISAGRIPNSA